MHIVEGRRNADSKLRLGFGLFYNVLSARKIYILCTCLLHCQSSRFVSVLTFAVAQDEHMDSLNYKKIRMSSDLRMALSAGSIRWVCA
jgi:hypothetical protein